jgi:hypothetical protein
MSNVTIDPRELLRWRTELSSPKVSSDNPAERGWYPAGPGHYRRPA